MFRLHSGRRRQRRWSLCLLGCIRQLAQESDLSRSAGLAFVRNLKLLWPSQNKSAVSPKSPIYRSPRWTPLGWSRDVRLDLLVVVPAQHAIASTPVGCEIRSPSQPVIYSRWWMKKTVEQTPNRRKIRFDVGRYVNPNPERVSNATEDFSTACFHWRRSSNNAPPLYAPRFLRYYKPGLSFFLTFCPKYSWWTPFFSLWFRSVHFLASEKPSVA